MWESNWSGILEETLPRTRPEQGWDIGGLRDGGKLWVDLEQEGVKTVS